MKNIPSLRAKRSNLPIIILVLFLILNSQFSIITAQEPAYMPDGAYIEQMLIIEGDTVYAIMPDTVGLYAINGKYFLTTVDFVEQYVAAHSGSGSIDSFYLSSTGQWITLGDTIPKDTVYNSLTANSAKFGVNGDTTIINENGIKTIGGSITATDSIVGIEISEGETVRFNLNRYQLILGSGNNNVVVDISRNRPSGTQNVLFGNGAGSSLISGQKNMFFGSEIGQFLTSGQRNIIIGADCGRFTTQINRLIVNSVATSSILEDTTNSIIYGNQTENTTSQHLYLNAQTHIKHNLYLQNSTVLPYFTSWIPTVPSVLTSNPDSVGKFTWSPLNTFDRFIATYAVTGNDTLGGSSAGNAIDIVTQYQWVNCRTSSNTWGIYTANNYVYDNDTIQYSGTSESLYPSANLTLGGTSNAYEFRWYNVTDGAALPGSIIFTPVAYPTPLYLSAYDVNADTNDRYVLQVRCLTGTADLTLYKGFIEIKNK